MAPGGEKIPVLKPSSIKRGYYFRTFWVYECPSGVKYDYRLYNKYGRELKLQTHGWRETSSFNVAFRDAFGLIFGPISATVLYR